MSVDITNDDLSGFRFLRCLFVTAPEGPNTSDNRFMVVGVYFRADETLNMEFQDCGFRGPARPMFLACGGRHAFQNCSFQTQSYPERGFLAQAHSIADVPDGVDVFSATPYEDANLPASSWLATTMMKDVSSTSPRLYACSLTDGNTQPTQPSVVMINVTHDPPAPRAGTPLAPAILWGVVGVFGARLVLIGCRFKRPPSTHPNSVNAPVLVEWGLVVPPAMGLVPWAAEGQSRGHILDLGNQIILAGALAPPLVKLGASMAPIEALPLLERCTTL